MIKEYSNTRTYWDVLVFVAIILSCVLIPLHTVFRLPHLENIDIFLYFLDSIFILDIFFNFFTSYHKNGLEITSGKAIARHYIFTLFFIDLIANIPVNYTLDLSHAAFLHILPLFRLLRIIRLFVILKRWENIRGNFAGRARIVKFVLMIMILAHWISCAWFLLAHVGEDTGNSWVVRFGLEDASHITQYIHSIYWTVITMTTVGYGDITPARDIELIFTTFIAVLGASSYAYVIGNIASLVSNMNASKAEFRRKVDTLSQYLHHRNIPHEINRMVTDYYDYLWARYRGQEENTFLADLPIQLRIDILSHLTSEFIESAPIFKHCEPALRNELIMSLKHQTYPPGCYVVRKGEHGKSIFFLAMGEMEIISDNKSRMTIDKGEYFGMLSLLLKEVRTASVRTLTYCEVFVLEKRDFDRIKDEYPAFRDVLQKVSSEKSDRVSALLLDGIIL